MSRRGEVWPYLAVFGGTLVGGGLLLALASQREARHFPEPTGIRESGGGFTDLDIEAAARMLASENPNRSERLHIEQIWTQLRAKKPRQSLFNRITAGSGWGPQGASKPPGGVRPVATENPATKHFRELAEDVLEGNWPSILPGARKFFEPAVQDRAFAQGELARAKLAAGGTLTEQEKRMLGYKMDAAHKRADWLKKSRFIGAIDGVEFFD